MKIDTNAKNYSLLVHHDESTRIERTKPLVKRVIEGACRGGVFGASSAASAVVIFGITEFFSVQIEKNLRAEGNPPRWPLIQGDCRLEQFRNHSVCDDPALYLNHFMLNVVQISAGCGAVIGAVAALVKWWRNDDPHTT